MLVISTLSVLFQTAIYDLGKEKTPSNPYGSTTKWTTQGKLTQGKGIFDPYFADSSHQFPLRFLKSYI